MAALVQLQLPKRPGRHGSHARLSRLCRYSFAGSFSTILSISWLWYIVGVTIYVNVHACAVSMATPMQIGRLFRESFFAKSSCFANSRKFSPTKVSHYTVWHRTVSLLLDYPLSMARDCKVLCTLHSWIMTTMFVHTALLFWPILSIQRAQLTTFMPSR